MMFDHESLLKENIDVKEQLKLAIEKYLEMFPQYIESLQADIDKQDLQSLEFKFHTLKGVIGNFKSPVLLEQLRELERYCKENKYTRLTNEFKTFLMNIDKFNKEISEFSNDLI